MKALILQEAGSKPETGDFDAPWQAQSGQTRVKIIAAGLNPVDRYMSMNAEPGLPRIVGREGIGQTEDGKRFYFDSPVEPYGSIAEQAVVASDSLIELPEGLKDGPALVIGIAGLAAWLPLSWKAGLQTGESVLVLGATGVQGQIAVQAAKLLGAGYVTAAGRDKSTLENLTSKGADNIAVLDGDLANAIKDAAPEGGYQIVVDSLFGEPFSAVIDSGCLQSDSRVVVIGGSAGQEVTLGFRQLQGTKGATIAGYSNFYVPAEDKRAAYFKMAEHIKNGKIDIEIEEFSLQQATEAWDTQSKGPHRKIIIRP